MGLIMTPPKFNTIEHTGLSDNSDDVSYWLHRWHEGDPEAADKLFRLVLPQLKKIAARCLARENHNRKHTFQRTELVDEGFIRLAQANRVVEWRDQGHFFAICTVKMSYILIEYA